MRVLFDLQALQTRSSRSRGIGFYTSNHASALAARPGVELHGLVNGWLPTGDRLDRLVASLGQGEPARLAEGDRLRDVEEREEHHRKAVEAGASARALERDCTIYHSTSPFEWEVWVPLAVPHVRVAATVYDLIPHLFPAEYLSGASPRFRHEYQRILDGLRHADLLLAISDCTKRDLVRSLDIPSERVHVIWAAVDDRFRVLADPDPGGVVRERWGTGERFVLYTGGYDFRKNFERLFEAFASSRARQTHKLVVVCRLTDEERRRVRAMGDAAGLADELVLTGFVPDEDQVRLYNLADLLVFPSRYEGFGLPVLEGMKCGIPVICSSVSSMPEIAGDAAELVDPSDPRAMREAIDGVLEHPARAAELRDRGARQAAKFTWDAVARATAEAYREIALAPRRPWLATSPSRGRARVAFFSPLPPAPSGIADFAGELLPALSDELDVTAFVDAPEEGPVATPSLAVEDGRLFDVVDGDTPFDRVIHQIGNSLHHEQSYREVVARGGVVMLHDLVLHHLVMAMTLDRGDDLAYHDELVRSHGRDGARVASLVARGYGSDAFYYQLGCLRGLLDRADAVITFSAHAERRVRALGYRRPSTSLPLAIAASDAPVEPRVARGTLGLDPDAFWIGSFGVQTPMKRPEVVIAAFSELRRRVPRARLVFVGESPPWARLAERVGASPDSAAITVTGRVDEDRYRAWMDACDAIVTLRYPHRGETSAAALKAMGRGRAVLASDLGAMAEVPRGAFLPIDAGARERAHLVATLRALAEDAALARSVGARARQHVAEHHAPVGVAERLVAFLSTLPPRPTLGSSLASRSHA